MASNEEKMLEESKLYDIEKLKEYYGPAEELMSNSSNSTLAWDGIGAQLASMDQSDSVSTVTNESTKDGIGAQLASMDQSDLVSTVTNESTMKNDVSTNFFDTISLETGTDLKSLAQSTGTNESLMIQSKIPTIDSKKDVYYRLANSDLYSFTESIHEEGLIDEDRQKLQDWSNTLMKAPIEEVSATSDEISALRRTNIVRGFEEITSFDLFNDNDKIVTGHTKNNKVRVFSMSTQQTIAEFTGHEKEIKRTIFHPNGNMVISASADKTIRLWSISQRKQVKLDFHKESVTGVSMHPFGEYLLSCSEDNRWIFSNINTGTVIQSQIVWASSDSRHEVAGSCSSLANAVILTCVKFHPHAKSFATGGMDSVVKIWDLCSKKITTNLNGHSGPINSLSFSANGNCLASATEDTFKLWDLRMPAKLLTSTEQLKALRTTQLVNIKDLEYDFSGRFVACAGDNLLHVYEAENNDPLINIKSTRLIGVRFWKNGKSLVTCSSNGDIDLFSS